MLRAQTKAVLRAWKEDDITARVDLLMEAFWDKSKDIDDIIRRLRHTCDDLRTLKVAPLISIKHCEKLLASVESFSWTEQEMPYTWFVTAVLHATGWIPEAGRDTFVARYLLVEPDDAPEPSGGFEVYEESLQENDFGFMLENDTKDEPQSFLALCLEYVFAAVNGVLTHHRERNKK